MKKIIYLALLLVLVSCSNANDVEITIDEKLNTNSNIKEKEKIDMNSKNIDKQNDKGETKLLLAVIDNDIQTAIRLIDEGANVNIQDQKSDSAYLYAGAEGRTEILEYMLKNAYIDFNVLNRFGGNTLIPAAEKGHLENVKLLVSDDRIDIDFQNDFGYTALIEAVALTSGEIKFQDIVKTLVDHGANISIRDNSGRTALDYARNKGYKEIENILLNK